MSSLKMSAKEIMSLLTTTFPQQAKNFGIDELSESSLVVRHKIDDSHLGSRYFISNFQGCRQQAMGIMSQSEASYWETGLYSKRDRY